MTRAPLSAYQHHSGQVVQRTLARNGDDGEAAKNLHIGVTKSLEPEDMGEHVARQG